MVLTAYVNGVGGENVMAGKLDAALAEINKTRYVSSQEYTAKVTNQCVTYTALKQLEQAKSACNEALRAAKLDRLGALRYTSGSSLQNSYVAIAYANRAVVNMLTKDAAAAQSDLAHAKSLAPDAEYVSRNLLAMQSSASKIAQIDVAPAR